MTDLITNLSPAASCGQQGVWLFGYGSLIYKVDFPYLERRPAHIHGWVRRLWQGSHDHRGTPQAPGRVVTLVAMAGADCIGMAYRVAPGVFAHLDHREKNGYVRTPIDMVLNDGTIAHGVVYVADAHNEAFLGAASESEIARHVASAHGPSGSNREYVVALALALRELGADDPHVYAVAQLLHSTPEPGGVTVADTPDAAFR